MVYGRYKNTYIWIIRDDTDSKWYGKDFSTFSHTEKYETVDKLRDALRLGTVTWIKDFSD